MQQKHLKVWLFSGLPFIYANMSPLSLLPPFFPSFRPFFLPSRTFWVKCSVPLEKLWDRQPVDWRNHWGEYNFQSIFPLHKNPWLQMQGKFTGEGVNLFGVWRKRTQNWEKPSLGHRESAKKWDDWRIRRRRMNKRHTGDLVRHERKRHGSDKDGEEGWGRQRILQMFSTDNYCH